MSFCCCFIFGAQNGAGVNKMTNIMYRHSPKGFPKRERGVGGPVFGRNSYIITYIFLRAPLTCILWLVVAFHCLLDAFLAQPISFLIKVMLYREFFLLKFSYIYTYIYTYICTGRWKVMLLQLLYKQDYLEALFTVHRQSAILLFQRSLYENIIRKSTCTT